MTEEIFRRCGSAISARTKDRDEITDTGFREIRKIGEPVEGCAETTDDVHDLFRLGIEAARNRNRVVATHDRAEIARRGELMMQPPSVTKYVVP